LDSWNNGAMAADGSLRTFVLLLGKLAELTNAAAVAKRHGGGFFSNSARPAGLRDSFVTAS